MTTQSYFFAKEPNQTNNWECWKPLGTETKPDQFFLGIKVYTIPFGIAKKEFVSCLSELMIVPNALSTIKMLMRNKDNDDSKCEEQSETVYNYFKNELNSFK
jgi:hypothetical protein